MRWRVDDSAVESYRRVADTAGTDDGQLRYEIIELAREAHQVTTKAPRADGLEVWRSRPPQRARLLVRREPDEAVIVRVEASHGGARVYRHRRGGESLGHQLRNHREQAGHSVETVAELAGLTVAEVEAVERGEGAASRVVEVLGLRVAVSLDQRGGRS